MGTVVNKGAVGGKGQLSASIGGIVFHTEGHTFTHPRTGEVITAPGTELVDGKRGTWYDYGELYKAILPKRMWLMLKLKIRIALANYLKRLNGRK